MANSNARDLRKSMTRQEVKLWQRLRELRAIGHHFRRQSPLAPYIVDFECRSSRVIVEVDGHQHGYDENRRRDAVCDNALAARGYRVLRFSNGEVDRQLDGVMEAIHLALASAHSAASPHPAATSAFTRVFDALWPPPSPRGEG